MYWSKIDKLFLNFITEESDTEMIQMMHRNHAKISNDYLDEIYEGSLDNGAIGGKLLGAGGGGFFLFFVPPFKRIEFVRYLTQKNLKIRSFKFDDQGLLSWNVRENFN